MWSIIWNIEDRIKHDILWFSSEAQALKYAEYYKSLLEVHDAGQHMQSRFGAEKKAMQNLKVSFELMKKKTAQNLPGLNKSRV